MQTNKWKFNKYYYFLKFCNFCQVWSLLLFVLGVKMAIYDTAALNFECHY